MKIRGIARLRRWTRQHQSKVVVLLYHRVFDALSDPQLLCVSPRHFAEHLQYLSAHYPILSLRELLLALRSRRLPKRAVTLTFDDGYADNLCNAKPLLGRYNAPATIFVTTARMSQEREFWWDELERLLLLTRLLPSRFRIRIGDGMHEWHIGKWARLSEEEISECRTWNVECRETPTPRHQMYLDLHTLLRGVGQMERERVLAILRAKIESDRRPSCRTLLPHEISKLADDELVEIGSHTVNHLVLSMQTLEVQQHELRESRRQLEAVLGRPVTSISYPYGGQADVGQAMELVQDAGYEVACANLPAPVSRESDPLFLPRFLVRDWSSTEFAQHVRQFFNS